MRPPARTWLTTAGVLCQGLFGTAGVLVQKLEGGAEPTEYYTSRRVDFSLYTD
jgi:hypothetical protein